MFTNIYFIIVQQKQIISLSPRQQRNIIPIYIISLSLTVLLELNYYKADGLNFKFKATAQYQPN